MSELHPHALVQFEFINELEVDCGGMAHCTRRRHLGKHLFELDGVFVSLLLLLLRTLGLFVVKFLRHVSGMS
jgi:hypothetical protein